MRVNRCLAGHARTVLLSLAIYAKLHDRVLALLLLGLFFALALSPASGRHSHSMVETAALLGTSAKIEREREKQCHEIFLPSQEV